MNGDPEKYMKWLDEEKYKYLKDILSNIENPIIVDALLREIEDLFLNKTVYLVEVEEKYGNPEGSFNDVVAIYLDKNKADERALLAQEEHEKIYKMEYPKGINIYDKEDDGYSELVYNVVEFKVSE